MNEAKVHSLQTYGIPKINKKKFVLKFVDTWPFTCFFMFETIVIMLTNFCFAFKIMI